MSMQTPPPRPTDRELAEQVVTLRAEAAFRELYRRHTPRLNLLLLRVLDGRASDAEDAVQDTWMRAAQRLAEFRWQAAFSTWLTGIGLNVARDLLRRRHRRRENVWEEADDPRVALPAHDGERVDLERAIARLPLGYRTVLLLHDVEGIGHEEIAGMLGITTGTSKSQLHGARRALRGHLDADPHGQEVGHA